jgi:membrane-associated phospholipid phosphatase
VQDSDRQDAQDGVEKPKIEPPAEPEAFGTRLRWQDIPRNVIRDEKAIFLSPFHIDRQNAKWWTIFGGATLAFIAVDQRISDRMPEETRLAKPSKWASRFGADYFLFPAWASFYLVGKAGDNPRARDTARIGIESLIDADITVNLVKFATQRPRPEHKGDRIGFFKGGDAFPSGHAIKAWSLAHVVAHEFPERKIVPVLAYGAATAVSISRVGGRRHSISDTVAGSAMGFFIGDFVYRHHHTPSSKSVPTTALLWMANHVTFEFGKPRPFITTPPALSERW